MRDASCHEECGADVCRWCAGEGVAQGEGRHGCREVRRGGKVRRGVRRIR